MRACPLVATVVVAVAITSTPARAGAQDMASGHAFVGAIPASPPSGRMAWGSGGGVEGWIGKGTSIGGEFEDLYMPAIKRQAFSARSENLMLLSVTASQYLAPSQGVPTWQPFITGGFGFPVDGPIGIINIGLGVDRWLTPNVGLRFELLDHLNANWLGFRVGVLFR
jgi:hypothetical protein